MTQTTATTATPVAPSIIVAFHIGRGGHFYNAGHKTFLGEHKIGEYIEDLFAGWENEADIENAIGERENLVRLFEDRDNDLSRNKLERRIGMKFGAQTYRDCNGNNIITFADVETGLGTINIDNDYDTTYTCFLAECDESECQIIRESREFEYLNEDAQAFVKYMIDEQEEEEEEVEQDEE